MDNINLFIGNGTLTISQAMQKIDNNSRGILFLVNDQNVLIGCITDGDIRRHLLAGGQMSDNAIKAANKTPRLAKTIEEAKLIYDGRSFIVIPIVNEFKVIIDIYFGESDHAPKKNRSTLNIPVVINAGGRGTRLDPFTRVLPKPLIPVGELPIIELIMKEYQTYSCNDFHIIVNYKRELMKAYFADNDGSYNISWYNEQKPLGTGGGLRLLKGKFDSTFFFANCDALLTADYAAMAKFHKENNNSVTMVCAYKNINIPYGVVEIGENGVINEMKEKPLFSFLTNTGIYIVEPDVIDDIGDDEVISFPEIVEREKQKGKKVAAYPVSENDWMDMGQLDELEKMRIKLYGK